MTDAISRSSNLAGPNTAELCLPPKYRKALLNTPELAALLKDVIGLPVAKKSLEKLRCVGGGPPFQRFGRDVRYPREAALEWAFAKLSAPMSSTSEKEAPQ
ncbi:DNA-binding protein [Ancylobacter aquaticus]|nr:DNA-binding protein [Ancylobacter aquaticus]